MNNNEKYINELFDAIRNENSCEEIENNKIHIVLSGLIGVGKSSFAQEFKNVKDLDVYEEEIVDNPYLSQFYNKPNEIAFHTQIYFFVKRLMSYNKNQSNAKNSIHDRHLIEDKVFAQTCFKQGFLNEVDYNTYNMLYNEIIKNIKIPNVIIYLDATAETCSERILKRSREIEKNSIPIEYLKQVDKSYQEFIQEYSQKTIVIILYWETFLDFNKTIEKITSIFTSSKKNIKNGLFYL